MVVHYYLVRIDDTLALKFTQQGKILLNIKSVNTCLIIMGDSFEMSLLLCNGKYVITCYIFLHLVLKDFLGKYNLNKTNESFKVMITLN